MAIPGSEMVFVDLTDQTVWHHGGGMFFHPENGFLYWTDGDNSIGDNDQIINKSLYSGVFRIDVDCRGGNVSHPVPRQPANGFTANYFIPNDNPFVGQSNVLEEFFCLGLRSPHRMTYDPPTGRIFIGDVGESSREEIDVIEPGESGLNFQWNRCEGNAWRNETALHRHQPRAGAGLSAQRRARDHRRLRLSRQGICDRPRRQIHFRRQCLIAPSGRWTKRPRRSEKMLLCVMPKGNGPNSGTDYTGLSSFGMDADGEIYFCQMSSIGGRIYTLARGGPPPPARRMPETAFANRRVRRPRKTLNPATGLIPYTVNSPLWSDGAVKTRWMALPTNAVIGFAAERRMDLSRRHGVREKF